MTNHQEILQFTDAVHSLSFEPLEKKYINVMIINTALSYLLVFLMPLFLLFDGDMPNRNIAIITSMSIIFIVAIVNMCLMGKACRYKGYAVREKDISYRRGFIYHNTVTIPFCKIQQVAISQSPIARLFHMYSLNITNGAQTESAITIPGLSQTKAESIKQLITSRINDANK